jgi:hypothetical protein
MKKNIPTVPNGGPVRIIEFRARNTKIIKAVDIYAGDRDIIVLTGKNRQGKTSILDAIWMALGGKEHIPDIPIRQGEKRAEIFLDLGDFSVTRKITPGGESLEVKGKDGIPMPSPQKFLNGCLAGLAHNPLEFMRLKPGDQVRALQKMLNIQLDRPEIERIAGSWTRTIKGDDPMLLIDHAIKGIFDERTGVNREIKRLDGVIESIKIPWEMADIQPVSIVDLVAERTVLTTQKQANDAIRGQAEKMNTGLESVREKILQKDSKIESLELEILTLKRDRGVLIQGLSELQEKYFEEADRVDGLIDPDFSGIDQRISEADQHNEQANRISGLKIALQKAGEDREKALADTEKLSGQIGDLNAYKLHLIGQTTLPFPGLGFENGQVTYAGLPLEQASGREQIEISCAICLAQHPKIGILTIDRGWSELDESGKTALRECALKAGAQVWVTQVTEEPGQEGFHIVAGELVAVDGHQVAEDLPGGPGGEDGSISADGILKNPARPADNQNEIKQVSSGPGIGLW